MSIGHGLLIEQTASNMNANAILAVNCEIGVNHRADHGGYIWDLTQSSD